MWLESESSESIVSLNVGGTIFQTSPLTMLKYPGSKMQKMFKEGQRNKNLTFFLDEDPEYFRIVLNFLRKGKPRQFWWGKSVWWCLWFGKMFWTSWTCQSAWKWLEGKNGSIGNWRKRNKNCPKVFDQSPWILYGQIL